jgi:hypothetical protein
MTESGVAATSMLSSGHDTPVSENRAFLLTASQYTRLQTSSLSNYRSIDVRPPDHRIEYHTRGGHLMFFPGSPPRGLQGVVSELPNPPPKSSIINNH